MSGYFGTPDLALHNAPSAFSGYERFACRECRSGVLTCDDLTAEDRCPTCGGEVQELEADDFRPEPERGER